MLAILFGALRPLASSQSPAADPPFAAGPSTGAAELGWSFPDWPSFPAGAVDLDRPRAAMDSAGGSFVAWTGSDAFGRDAVWFSQQLVGQAWQAPEKLWVAGPGQAAAAAELAIDSRGAIHVAWSAVVGSETQILHIARPVGGRWSAPEPVGEEPGLGAREAPAMAADFWGNLLVAWTDYRHGPPALQVRRRAPSGVWSAEAPLAGSGSGDQHAVRLAVMPSGWTYAVWEDTRAATNAIYASALPPGGDVWWPAAQLSHAARRRQSSPAVTADGSGNVLAVWLDEGDPATVQEDGSLDQGALRAALLRSGESFWDADREVYRPERGRLLAVDAAGGGAAADGSKPAATNGAVVAWSEWRAEGARIYAAPWVADGPLSPRRVDPFPVTSNGRQPSVTMDAEGRAHAVWLAESPQSAGVGVAHASLEPPAASAALTTVEGWLSYVASAPNCSGPGYLVTDCDGTTGPFAYAGEAALDPLLGQYVVVSGRPLVAGGCRFLRATKVQLKSVPCPRETGALVGRLTAGGDRPAFGATIVVGGQSAIAGADGRYFVDGLDAGTYSITASLPCALDAVIDDVRIRARDLTVVDSGDFMLGDVATNCAVDLADLVRVASRLRRAPADVDACTDLDADGLVTWLDLGIIRANYGAGCPQPWRPKEGLGR